MENKQAILLLSGGIDSSTLLAKLANENTQIVALSFDYGQKHNIELEYAKQNSQKYAVKNHYIIQLDKKIFASSALINYQIDIDVIGNHNFFEAQNNAYVPFRNLLFISTALSLAQTMNINQIYAAFNKDDSNNYWDCTPNFIDKITAIANTANSSIKINTPFIHMSKTEVIQLAYQLNVDLQNTITCYQPKNKIECGFCLSCITKKNAIENAIKL
jgi:7-cyano-7-deazaguanine synthase